MVNLTKGVSVVQGAIQKTINQTTPKAIEAGKEVAEKTTTKLEEDIAKIDFIYQCAKERAMYNLPDYIEQIIKQLNR